jgi:hypothetical protein
MAIFIPWTAAAGLSEAATRTAHTGSLRDCIKAYLRLDRGARREAMIITDVDVPLSGRRATKVLEFDEIEWLVRRLVDRRRAPQVGRLLPA